MTDTRELYSAEHEEFRQVVREFLGREVVPRHPAWERAGQVDKAIYAAAAKRGVVGFTVPAEYGGLGVDDFRYNAVVAEEMARARVHGPAFTLINDVIAPYLLRLAHQGHRRRRL